MHTYIQIHIKGSYAQFSVCYLAYFVMLMTTFSFTLRPSSLLNSIPLIQTQAMRMYTEAEFGSVDWDKNAKEHP